MPGLRHRYVQNRWLIDLSGKTFYQLKHPRLGVFSFITCRWLLLYAAKTYPEHITVHLDETCWLIPLIVFFISRLRIQFFNTQR